MEGNDKYLRRESTYRVRLLASLAISELLLLAMFYFSPIAQQRNSPSDVSEKEKVDFQQIEVTRHADIPASPPKPTVPLRMPEEKVIEEEIKVDPLQQDITLPDNLADGYGSGSGEGAQVGKPVNNPDRPPQLFKIVEPETPDKAKKAGIKVIIEVRFLIDATGEVAEASIANIKLYESEGGYRQVNHIDYGLTKATLNAALQWKFRPAIKNGKKVASYSIHPFTYGF